MNALETYLRELAAIRPVAVKETSYYPALSNLFNEIGRGLKPRVRCVIHPSSSGAGLPNGGFFTPDQLRGASDADLIAKVPPSRGVIEAKGTGENADTIAHSPQVAKYLERYGQVLVTTLRDFVLVGKDANGKAAILERYSLAPNEAAFWTAAARAHETAEAQGERFAEYVKRVILHAAPLTRPQDVAWFLASYARDARARLNGTDLPALAGIRTAMEHGLGLRFEGEKGDHFFLSTFLQTLFYGIFSAWVLWHNEQPTRTESFRWRDAELYLRVPVIAALFEQLSTRSRLEPLGLVDVLDWTAATLNRVDRAAFTDCYDRRTTANFVDFLARVDGWVPAEAECVYAIMDNLSAHRSADALLFSARHPRWRFVFQPTYAPYLNLIEPWRKTLRSLALKGRRFESWGEVVYAIAEETGYWNAQRHPFVWGRRRRRQPQRGAGIAQVANVA